MSVSDIFEAVWYYGGIFSYIGMLVHNRNMVLNLIIIWGIVLFIWERALMAVYVPAWFAAPLVCSLGLCDRAALGAWGSAGFWQTIDDFAPSWYELNLYYFGSYYGGRVIDFVRPFFDVAMHLAPFLENRRYLFRNSKIEMHLLKEKKHH